MTQYRLTVFSFIRKEHASGGKNEGLHQGENRYAMCVYQHQSNSEHKNIFQQLDFILHSMTQYRLEVFSFI